MAKQKSVESSLTPEYKSALEGFLAENDPKFIAPESIEDEKPVIEEKKGEELTPLIEDEKPEEKPEKKEKKVETPKAEEKVIDPKTGDATIEEEENEFTLELEPELPETDWDVIAAEVGIDAKGKDAVIAEIKKLKSEREELNKEVEQVRNYNAVKSQLDKADELLRKSPEDLVRLSLELKGHSAEAIERKVQKMIDNDSLEDAYDDVCIEIKQTKNQLIANAPKIREANEAAQTTANAEFKQKAIEKVKTLSTIQGLAFKQTDLATLHSRAERLLQSPGFHAKLRDPEFVAELAFQVAAGKSVEKAIENKVRNLARNQVANDFGAPTNRSNKGVQRPAHLEAKLEQPDKLKKFIEEDMASGEFKVGA